MKKHVLIPILASFAFLATLCVVSADGPVQVLQLPTTGGFGQVSLTLAAGQYVTVDSNGNPIAATPVVYAPLPRAGSVTTTVVGGLTKVVTFSTPLANANYALALSGSGITSGVVLYSNKTAAGFTINLSLATAGTIDYTATPYQ